MVISNQIKIERRKHKPWQFLCASFFMPVILTALSFAALQIVPFGNQSLVVSDANVYYMPYLSYLKTILEGEHDLFYSFSQSIGSGIAATIWPYLLNPFAWMVKLFIYEQYPLAYSLAVLLAAGLYGICMYLLLADLYGHKGSNLIFSTCYAMCGFNVAFLINTAFFFSGPLCLPLMVLGLRKLMQGKSPLLYIFSIAYPLIQQLQMGFAICMASVLFFFAYLYTERPKEGKTLFIRYFVTSVIGGLICAIVWMPEMAVLRQGRGAINIEDFTFSSNAPLLEMGTRFFTGAGSVNQVADGYPAVFVGMLPIAFSVLYFLNKSIDKRRKTSYAVILLVYLLGFYIRFFTSVFQGFTHANWFNYRFSFVFSFVMILIAAEEMTQVNSISPSEMKLCGGIILGATLLISFKTYEFVDGGEMLLDLILLGAMGGALRFYQMYPERAPQKVLILFFAVCTFFQLYLNNYLCNQKVLSVWDTTIQEYQENLIEKQPLIYAALSTDEDFYRMESEIKLNNSIGNDGLFLAYNGVGFAGHTERQFVSRNLGKLGVDFSFAYWNSYDAGIPAATDSLLGIKYMISSRDLAEEKNYYLLSGMLGNNLYENPYALPIAILSNQQIMGVSLKDEINAFANLNRIWRAMTGGSQDLFREETDITFTSHNPTDGHTLTYEQAMAAPNLTGRTMNQNAFSLDDKGEEEKSDEQNGENDNLYRSYIECCFTAEETGPVYLYDSASIDKVWGSAEDIMQYVGWYEAGEEVSAKLYLEYAVTEELMVATVQGLHICYADMDLLEEYSNLLQKRNVTIEKISDSHLLGDVEVEEGQRLLFTIPYDKGWTMTVDGMECPLEPTADLFMSADIGPGAHHYELTFIPEDFPLGAVISCTALLVLVMMCAVKVKKRPGGDGYEEAAI